MPSSPVCPNGHPVTSDATTCPQCNTLIESGPLLLPSSPILPALPGYEVLAKLGEGGMGIVYRARHLALKRIVALKMIRDRGWKAPSAQERARFRSEAESFARLHHPNIVQIFEVGEHLGQPYFAMEYVDGGNLASRALRLWSGRDAASIVEKLARAMNVAHQQRLVHLDLKPENVLLSETGEPKITDFGLAQPLEDDDARIAGWVGGTPGYMAPEQCASEGALIGPAADVFGLGAILYRLTTGRPPVDFSGMAVSEERTVRDWRELLDESYRKPIVPLRKVTQDAHPDVDAVCRHCLEHNPLDRYRSAEALADDLRRFLHGEPTSVRPVGRFSRLGMWARRRPVEAALWTLAILLLIAGMAVSSSLALGLYNQNQTLQTETKRANNEAFAHAIASAEAKTARKLADRRLYAANSQLIERAHQESQLGWQNELLEASLPESTGDVDLRGFEWYYRRRLSRPHLALPAHGTSIAFRPDGGAFAYIAPGGVVKVWDLVRAKDLLEVPKDEGHQPFDSIAYSPNGKYLAAGRTSSINLWDSEGRPLFSLPGQSESVPALAFSPDSRWLAIAGRDIRIWDLEKQKVRHVFKGSSELVVGLAFSGDGTLLASTTWGFILPPETTLWHTESGKALQVNADASGEFHSVAFAPKTFMLATGGGNLKLWDIQDRSFKASRSISNHRVGRVAFSADGRMLAGSCPLDKTVRLWDVASGAELAMLRSHHQDNQHLAFSPDGSLLTCLAGDELRCWRIPEHFPSREWFGHSHMVIGVAFDRDGRLISAAGNEVEIREPRTGKLITCQGHRDRVACVAVSPKGDIVASGSVDKTVKLWDSSTGKELSRDLNGHKNTIQSLAFHPDAKRLATASADKGIIWDLAERKAIATIPLDSNLVLVTYHPDGKHLVIGTADHVIRVHDAESAAEIYRFPQQPGAFRSLAFNPAGTLLASGSSDALQIWDFHARKELHNLKGHAGDKKVLAVAFSADGRRLVSAGDDGTIRLWDVELGHELLTLNAADRFLTSVAFSPDGELLAAGHMWWGRKQDKSTQGGVTVWWAPRDWPANALRLHAPPQ